MTKLQGVNAVLRAINLPPVTALPSASSDTSVNRHGEDQLEFSTTEVLNRGFPCNTRFAVEHTLDGSGEIDLSASNPAVLKVRGTAPGQFRGDDLSLQAGKVYSNRLGGTDLGTSGDKVYIDLILDLDFANVAPDVQQIIVSEARQQFQREKQGSVQSDQFIETERVTNEVQADRLTPDRPALGTFPYIPSGDGGNGRA